jgi:hypothetical protein
MPTYHFACEKCDDRYEIVLPVAERGNPGPSPCCAVRLDRRPERFTAHTFEPYFDEALGCDVETLSQKKHILAEMGLIETGDRVGGARAFDPKAPNILDKQPVKGVPYRKRKHNDDSAEVTVVSADGRERKTTLGELPVMSDKVDHKAAAAAFTPKTP